MAAARKSEQRTSQANSARGRRGGRTGRALHQRRVAVLYALLVVITGLLTIILLSLPRETPPDPERVVDGPEAGLQPEREGAYLDTADESSSAGVPRQPEQPPPEERTPEPDLRPEPLPSALRPIEEAPRLYFVLDDAGASLEEIEPFLRLEFPFTVAILPHLPASREVADAALESGRELILHQPMEALNAADPGPGAIELGHDEEDVRAILERNLSLLPPVVGANNHMGSRVTEDKELMRAVLGDLHERELFFLDSRTTHHSVARKIAREVGILFMERDVFLDHDPQREAIEAALQHALTIAETKGHAVMIGHVMVSELAEVFEDIYPELAARGYRFEPLSEYFEHSVRDAVGDDDPGD